MRWMVLVFSYHVSCSNQFYIVLTISRNLCLLDNLHAYMRVKKLAHDAVGWDAFPDTSDTQPPQSTSWKEEKRFREKQLMPRSSLWFSSSTSIISLSYIFHRARERDSPCKPYLHLDLRLSLVWFLLLLWLAMVISRWTLILSSLCFCVILLLCASKSLYTWEM
jgi:hypothetical protein